MIALLSLSQAACAPPPQLVGDTWSEDGTWHLRLGETLYDVGENAVRLSASTAAEAPAGNLTVIGRPDMRMDHTQPLSTFEEGELGIYAADLSFPMDGIWTITGYVGDAENTEGFALVVEVHP